MNKISLFGMNEQNSYQKNKVTPYKKEYYSYIKRQKRALRNFLRYSLFFSVFAIF